MTLRLYPLSVLLLAGALLFGCKGGSSRSQTAQAESFTLPSVPAMMEGEARTQYLVEHYWDRFRFEEPYFDAQDSASLFQHFITFSTLLSDTPTQAAPVERLFSRAAGSKRILDFFVDCAEKVFDDPNSPLRNDEFYIPVLQEELASGYYPDKETWLRNRLAGASLNRLGHKANDFSYTVASGARGTLYGIKAPYTLVFFNNPGCQMCRSLREEIAASQLLPAMIAKGDLKVIALYPDADLTEWFNYRSEIPSNWINAYDEGCVINETRSYDVSAIPSLYLLDREKTVLVKDGTDVAQIERVILGNR